MVIFHSNPENWLIVAPTPRGTKPHASRLHVTFRELPLSRPYAWTREAWYLRPMETVVSIFYMYCIVIIHILYVLFYIRITSEAWGVRRENLKPMGYQPTASGSYSRWLHRKPMQCENWQIGFKTAPIIWEPSWQICRWNVKTFTQGGALLPLQISLPP